MQTYKIIDLQNAKLLPRYLQRYLYNFYNLPQCRFRLVADKTKKARKYKSCLLDALWS